MSYKDIQAFIDRYIKQDVSYAYHCLTWYSKEAETRTLTHDENRIVVWLKSQWGLDAMFQERHNS